MPTPPRASEPPDERRIEAARQDPNEFIEYAFEDRHGKPVRQGRVHREWQALWSSHKRVIIEAARDHGKSFQAIARVIWELGKNPNLRIKFICQSDPRARERLGEIRAHIMLSPKVREVFPGLMPADDDSGSDWNKHRLVVKRQFISKDPSVEAHGVMSSGTGGRADLIIFDDVCDLRNTILIPALREQVKMSFRAVWINLLEPDGRAWYIATPYHTMDLTHELRQNVAYTRRAYPIGAHLEPVWPEVWPVEELQSRLDEIGDREFKRAFQLIALSDSDMTFPSFAKVLEACKGYRIRDLVPAGTPIYAGMDVSSSKRKGTVLFAIARLEDGTRVPVDIESGAWKSPEIVRRAVAFYHRHLPQLFYVENNGVQTMLVEWLEESGEDVIPVQGFHTGSQKADPLTGLPSIEVELANGSWMIPSGEFEDHEGGCECSWCEWVREMRTHPISSTTDHIMACWFAREAARHGYSSGAAEALDHFGERSIFAEHYGPVSSSGLEDFFASSERQTAQRSHKPSAPARSAQAARDRRGPEQSDLSKMLDDLGRRSDREW